MKQITTFIFFVLITTIVQAQQPAKVRAEVGPTAEELKRQKELETFIAKQDKLSNLLRENNISPPSLMGFGTSDKEVINRIIKTNQDLINKINVIAGLKSLSMEVHTMSKSLGHKTTASTDYVTHILEKANENIRRGKARLTELENPPKNTDNKNVTVIKPIAPPENNWGFDKPKEEQKIEIAKINNKDIEILTDIDGNKYYVVIIGNLKWMGEDLRVTRFNDGTPIPDATNLFLKECYSGFGKDRTIRLCNDYDQFEKISTPYFHKGNIETNGFNRYVSNESLIKEAIKLYSNSDLSKYFIYNGYVLLRNDLCPKGWRLPTIDEVKFAGKEIKFYDYYEIYKYSTNYPGFSLNGLVGSRGDYDLGKTYSDYFSHYWTSETNNIQRANRSFNLNKGTASSKLTLMLPVRCVCDIK